MKLENRYIVVKRSDATLLSPKKQAKLCSLLAEIEGLRVMVDRKPPQSYICIGKNSPEYEPTLKLLSDRVDKEGSDENNHTR